MKGVRDKKAGLRQGNRSRKSSDDSKSSDDCLKTREYVTHSIDLALDSPCLHLDKG